MRIAPLAQLRSLISSLNQTRQQRPGSYPVPQHLCQAALRIRKDVLPAKHAQAFLPTAQLAELRGAALPHVSERIDAVALSRLFQQVIDDVRLVGPIFQLDAVGWMRGKRGFGKALVVRESQLARVGYSFWAGVVVV